MIGLILIMAYRNLVKYDICCTVNHPGHGELENPDSKMGAAMQENQHSRKRSRTHSDTEKEFPSTRYVHKTSEIKKRQRLAKSFKDTDQGSRSCKEDGSPDLVDVELSKLFYRNTHDKERLGSKRKKQGSCGGFNTSKYGIGDHDFTTEFEDIVLSPETKTTSLPDCSRFSACRAIPIVDKPFSNASFHHSTARNWHGKDLENEKSSVKVISNLPEGRKKELPSHNRRKTYLYLDSDTDSDVEDQDQSEGVLATSSGTVFHTRV